MDGSRNRAWVVAALLTGAAYFLIGRVFAQPAFHGRAWRLAAWAISGGAYVAHLAYEHFTLRTSSRAMAWHAALAVALGAFALALAAMMHSLSPTAGIRPVWLLALVLWPAITAIPAYLVARVAGAVLGRSTRSADPGPNR